MASSQLFDLVYAGAVLDGFSEEQVKVNFAKHLKLSEGKVDKLFTGRRVTLKKAIAKEKAEQWQQKLLKIGAEIVLVPALNAEQINKPKYQPKTASLFEENSGSSPVQVSAANSNGPENSASGPTENHSRNENIAGSQQEYDEDMQKRIARAQALIAAQQMEQQSGVGKKDDSMKRLWVFTAILLAAILFLYFYAESIA